MIGHHTGSAVNCLRGISARVRFIGAISTKENFRMTRLFEQAVEAVRNLSPDEQDDIARVVLRLAGADDEPPVSLTPDEQTAIANSKAAAARGEFATDEQVRAVWAKHGL
jgi:hypothetical protein